MVTRIEVAQVGAYVEVEGERVEVAQVGAYVELESQRLEIAQFSAYIEVEEPLAEEKYGPKLQVI